LCTSLYLVIPASTRFYIGSTWVIPKAIIYLIGKSFLNFGWRSGTPAGTGTKEGIAVGARGDYAYGELEKLRTLPSEIRNQITSLRFNVDAIDSYTLYLYFMAFPNVKELRMSRVRIGEDILQVLRDFKGLEKADLRCQSWEPPAQVREGLAITWINYVDSP